MGRKICISFVVFVSFLSANLVAAENASVAGSSSLAAKRACKVIRNNVKKGNDISNLVKTSIQLGFDACFVIRCAVEADGDLEQIVNGAAGAGSTSDVIARCAVNAGADYDKLASIFTSAELFSLCYLPPLDEVIPVETSFPGGGGGDGRRMSPSSF